MAGETTPPGSPAGHAGLLDNLLALASALAADPQAKAAFDALSFTHRKEYARAIAEAKREETRDRRVAQTLEKLREGKAGA